MPKYNLLGHPERLKRDVSLRVKNKQINKKIALKFGEEYFDGKREFGYGGYNYDGRWIEVGKRLIERYQLDAGSKFLDVGCAKGFLMHDLVTLLPKIDVVGLDISAYAKEKAFGLMYDKIHLGNCVSLPFKNDSFDASVAINTLHNLNEDDCKQAIRELIRVTRKKSNIFIQVDAYSNSEELEMFEDWVLTAKTYKKPKDWINLFDQVNFKGDYFWTIIGFSD